MSALRPFPFPAISIGTDITHLPRIARIVRKRATFPRFLNKVLTTREQHDFHKRFSERLQRADRDDGKRWGEGEQEDQWLGEATGYLAGRWAAKEAIVKACSWRSLTFDEIQVLKDESSKRIYGVILDKPSVKQTVQQTGAKLFHVGKADLVEEPGQVVKLSISHDGEYATAMCMAAFESRADEEAVARGGH